MKAPLPSSRARTLTANLRSKRSRRALFLAALAAAAVVGACGGQSEEEGAGDGDGDGDSVCAPGSEGCECYGNGSCDGDLSCLSDRCVDDVGDGDGDGDGDEGTGGISDGSGGDSSGGNSSGGDTGTGGAGDVCDCNDEQSCVEGECVAWECVPDERFCSGNAVRLCAADGLGSDEDEACEAGNYCDAESAECVVGVCAPDEPACDGNSARWCNMAGTGYEPGGTPCDSDETCDVGVCEPHVCPAGEAFCDGQQVMACAENGLSVSLVEACADQACLESDGSASCEGVCEPTQTQCSGNGVQTCSASGVWGTAAACAGTAPVCSDGTCGQPPSCENLAATCGPNGNESCCTSLPVTGGTFYRGEDTSYPTTISNFLLDKYEVTVGRFRKFAAAWNDGYRPTAGAGKHAHLNAGAGLSITAGGNEPGWDTAWAGSVDASDTARSAGTTDATWTSSEGAFESLPVDYVNWFESAAFCIWDGGFLASEAEWEYAAVGGDEERVYPWGDTPPTCGYANIYYDNASCEAAAPYSAPAGTRSPTGDGLWGQSDLAGNLQEWTLDWYAASYGAVCNNCTNATTTSHRMVRGGSWGTSGTYLAAANRTFNPPANRYGTTGLRCARTP